jgi:hypothetical protein
MIELQKIYKTWSLIIIVIFKTLNTSAIKLYSNNFYRGN